ncbi:MAG: hypothetical protein K9H64_18150 [Bacteroidales bacterium]|nr:hypothetical protein [Bacteroidales bacterium]MCF8457958.1 hypothetical protein [Bacteroidales bacterium]
MILNESYYQTLWEKFGDVKHLTKNFETNGVQLSVKIILKHYQENKPLHINFQNSKESLFEIGRHLFIEFANDIYLNHYGLPTLKKGSKLRDKRKYSDGKKHDYIIKSIRNNSYLLEDIKNKAQLNLKYDALVNKFIPIEQGTRQSTLVGYTKYFSEINGGLKLNFTPTNFDKKTVFISHKPLWDSLIEKNKIPSSYLPNPREEDHLSETKSIPALSDCLVYFTPKYEVCYQNILLKGEKIKTIIIFDTEVDKIEQILLDKQRYGFNLFLLSNSFSPLKNQAIPCWDWFKEEIEIVNSL